MEAVGVAAPATSESLESAENIQADIVANAEGQRSVGIELVEVRVLEVSATARADAG
jgi:hypothetical protein